MADWPLATIKVKSKEHDGEIVQINASEFNEDLHTRVKDSDLPPPKPVKTADEPKKGSPANANPEGPKTVAAKKSAEKDKKKDLTPPAKKGTSDRVEVKDDDEEDEDEDDSDDDDDDDEEDDD